MARYTYQSKSWADLPSVPIVDATDELQLDIRYTDAKFAENRNPEKCAVARACLRSCGGKLLGVKIGAGIALLHFGDRIVRFVVSSETRKMVKAYDAVGFFPSGVKAKLLPPPATKKIGARKGEKKGGPHNGKGKPNVRSAQTPWLRHVNQPSAA